MYNKKNLVMLAVMFCIPLSCLVNYLNLYYDLIGVRDPQVGPQVDINAAWMSYNIHLLSYDNKLII